MLDFEDRHGADSTTRSIVDSTSEREQIAAYRPYTPQCPTLDNPKQRSSLLCGNPQIVEGRDTRGR